MLAEELHAIAKPEPSMGVIDAGKGVHTMQPASPAGTVEHMVNAHLMGLEDLGSGLARHHNTSNASVGEDGVLANCTL